MCGDECLQSQLLSRPWQEGEAGPGTRAKPISKRKEKKTFLFNPYAHRYGKLSGTQVTSILSSITTDITN